MALPSFLRPRSQAKADPPAAGPSAQAPEAARTRARRRLIGAVVLLGIGVIAFPLVFETEPRPIPVDLPIVIPRKESAPPLAMPAPAASAAPRSASAPPPPMITERPDDQASAPAAVVARETPAPVSAAAPASTPASGATLAPASRRDDSRRVQALLEGKAASAPATAPRYVVQIGAFAEDKAVREVRAKAQKAGLETYTQVINVAAGPRTRVRIGPFDKREAAEAAAAKAMKAGLQASIVKL